MDTATPLLILQLLANGHTNIVMTLLLHADLAYKQGVMHEMPAQGNGKEGRREQWRY